MSDQPDELLSVLHLHQAGPVMPHWLDRAAQYELNYHDFVQGLLEQEITGRTAAEIDRRLRQTTFPFAASIEQFDFCFRPEFKRQVVLRSLHPTFVAQAGTLTLIGPLGLGKTMLAICIANKQVQLGETARFIMAQALANQLERTTTIVGRQRALKPLLTCDVLVIDELGYLPMEISIVQDVSLAAAIVDRLLHHCQVFYLKGPSSRTKDRDTSSGQREDAAAL